MRRLQEGAAARNDFVSQIANRRPIHRTLANAVAGPHGVLERTAHVTLVPSQYATGWLFDIRLHHVQLDDCDA